MGAPRAAAIVVAAGSGIRLGSIEGPKALVELDGTPMVTTAVLLAASVAAQVVVAAPAGYEDAVRAALPGIEATVVTGASTRQGSVLAALEAIPEDSPVVVVHDAARPFATRELFVSVIAAIAAGADGAVPVVPIPDTVKRVRGGVVVATEDRADLGLAQTPQAFRADVLRAAHEAALAAGVELTDDAALLERAGHRVVVVPGEARNLKITTAADLERVRGDG